MMDQNRQPDYKNFYELMFDNLPDGVYILDADGNYIYANSVYIHLIGLDRATLMKTNVHDLLHSNQIDICISDIVYQEKRRVVMFQDVTIIGGSAHMPFRQLVISNPVFGEDGTVQNILAVCRPLETLNSFYNEAASSEINGTCIIPQADECSPSIVAESHSMQRILQLARDVAEIDASVLISGESGTGKEVVAQYIHSQGHRRDGELVVINCAALPENLLEAELFGYEKGAFTGASAKGKAGLFELASGGTLFLDEINSMPISLQGKLLRAIETKTIQRIGATASKKVDFRLIAATNENLLLAVEDKRFRADLLYRLNVIPLELPPLRDRREDIVPLALYFLDHYNKKYNKNKRFGLHTLESMEAYDWGGNVRELKNFVERSVVMSAGDYIDLTNIHSVAASYDQRLPEHSGRRAAGLSHPWEECLGEEMTLQDYMDRCEREYLAKALMKHKTSYEVAKALGTSQSSIMRRKAKYGL